MALTPTQVGNVAERLQTTPVTFSRTLRPDSIRTVTSGKAGFAIPLGFIPLLREDGLESSPVRASVYMDETADLLLNTVHCVFSAYLVPKLAFDRFEASLDALNRSYLGQQEKDGSVIPWIVQDPIATGDPGSEVIKPFYQYAGLHAGSDSATVNSDYIEAYYKIFEYRARQRSESLWRAVENDPYNGELVPAFFDNPQMGIIKPSFDDAMLDGEVPLTITNQSMPVVGLGRSNANAAQQGSFTQTDGTTYTGQQVGLGTSNNQMAMAVSSDGLLPQVFAEMQDEGITVSVANIDLAREMSAWARVRARYSGLDDDELIDLLMSGVAVPTLYQAQPMLLARSKVPMGMTQRYSTEAASLDVSATRGVTGADMMLRAPATNTGGVIVIQAEVVPEQFWERSKDYHLMSDTDTRRPDRLLDQLDPQAVELVSNDHADMRHSDPTGVFGYAPLNHGYVRKRFNLGGKLYKSDPAAAWSEDRNRIWGSEPIDPTLSKEFFLATDLPDDVFLYGDQDNFEFSLAVDGRVSGLTYVGPLLREQEGQYDAIAERVNMTRIEGTPVDSLPPAQADSDVIDDEKPKLIGKDKPEAKDDKPDEPQTQAE